MPKNLSRWIFSTLVLILVLSACSLPASSPPVTQDANPAYTAAAQTIIAQLTQVAGTLQPTLPVATSVPGTLPPSPEPGETSSPAAPATASPSPEPTATELEASPAATVTEEPTAAPTATTSPSDPRADLGDPDFRDTFENGENWALYEDEHVSFDTDDGELVMTAFEPDLWEGWMLSWPVLEDFYLELAATNGDCSGLDRYGILVRAIRTADGDYVAYFYGLTCDGRYSLRRWDGERFITLIDWTSSEAINAGEGATNRLGLLAEGDTLSLYANGELLEAFSDDNYEMGRFGVFIGSVNTSDFTVQAEQLAYWELP